MNEDVPIGINDIAIYIPGQYIALSNILDERRKSSLVLKRKIETAIQTTEQVGLRFPEVWEDSSTMASSAAFRLLNNNLSVPDLRYLTVGTETSVDHAKPISTYVLGMLQKSGINIPSTISTFQVQHACASGTMALFATSGLLKLSPVHSDTGLVICSDIAHYKTHTTAEITQGAGAVALLVGKNPQLLQLDIQNQGYSSSDVDDFFRPLGSSTAVVRGGYSMKCYEKALIEALENHSHRIGCTPDKILEASDAIVMHTPFKSMPCKVTKRLLHRYCGFDDQQAQEFLDKRGFDDGLDPVSRIGNIYSGSLYLSLAFTMENMYKKIGEKIAGKKILMASYGSGNTMIVFSGTIAPDAHTIIPQWNLKENILNAYRNATFSQYRRWTESPFPQDQYNTIIPDENIPHGRFYLKRIREDGYHIYDYSDAVPSEAKDH